MTAISFRGQRRCACRMSITDRNRVAEWLRWCEKLVGLRVGTSMDQVLLAWQSRAFPTVFTEAANRPRRSLGRGTAFREASSPRLEALLDAPGPVPNGLGAPSCCGRRDGGGRALEQRVHLADERVGQVHRRVPVQRSRSRIKGARPDIGERETRGRMARRGALEVSEGVGTFQVDEVVQQRRDGQSWRRLGGAAAGRRARPAGPGRRRSRGRFAALRCRRRDRRARRRRDGGGTRGR